MAKTLFPPKKPLNFVIKQQLLQTLRRTDVYIIENNDTENALHSSSVNNWRDETLIKYDYDQNQGSYTIAFMGEVVAQMDMHKGMALSQQHKDILAIGKKIDAKSAEQKKIFDAKHNMTKEENLVYQRAMKEFQNARYD